MRIGTWNLAGRWDARHLALIEAMDCDVLLLTEAFAGCDSRRGGGLAPVRPRQARGVMRQTRKRVPPD